MSNYFKAKRNIKTITTIAERIIDSSDEKLKSIDMSCKKTVMQILDAWLTSRKDEVARFSNSENYERRTYTMLYRSVTTELTSGKHHLYRGVLMPHSQAESFLLLFEYCLNWYVSEGDLNEESAKDERDYLNKMISEVG